MGEAQRDRRYGNLLRKLTEQRSALDAAYGEGMSGEAGGGTQASERMGRQYMSTWRKLMNRGWDPSEGDWQEYQFTSESPWNANWADRNAAPPSAPVHAPDQPTGDGPAVLPGVPTEPDPENPYGGQAADAPDWQNFLNELVQGMPPGLDVTSVSGARALETLFPMLMHKYNTEMQSGAIDVGYQALDAIRDNPILKQLSGMVSERMSNPFTFDDETVGLMRGRYADTAANQEAAMRDRIQAMGARQGISPDSPLYATLASQAVMARDINQANMERNLDIEMARQKKTDVTEAIGLGSGFAGATMAMGQQGYANLANLYSGSRLAGAGNPFEGLTASLMLRNAMSDARPSGFETTMGNINLGLDTVSNLAGTVGDVLTLGQGNNLGNLEQVFSDRRLKTDIRLLVDGTPPIYEWRYKWDDPSIRRVGPMAQDVEKIAPNMVVEIAGFKALRIWG